MYICTVSVHLICCMSLGKAHLSVCLSSKSDIRYFLCYVHTSNTPTFSSRLHLFASFSSFWYLNKLVPTKLLTVFYPASTSSLSPHPQGTDMERAGVFCSTHWGCCKSHQSWSAVDRCSGCKCNSAEGLTWNKERWYTHNRETQNTWDVIPLQDTSQAKCF